MRLPKDREREAARPPANPTRARSGTAKPKLPVGEPELSRAERLALRTAARAPVSRRPTRSPGRSTPATPATPAAPAPRQPWLPFLGSNSGKARLRPDLLTRRLLHLGMAVLALLLLFGAGMVVYHLSSGFRLFALQRIDVRGTQLLSQEEVESTVRDLLQEGVLRADLIQLRNTLRRQELVEDVEVTRLLPDTIRLVVRERDPVALARRADGSIVCVDRHGVMFGRASLYKDRHQGRPLPPLITGLREPGWETTDPSLASASTEPLGADAPLTPLKEASLPSTVGVNDEAADFNRRSVETYLRLLADIDQGFPALSTRLDEVQFDEFDDVRVTLSDSKTIVYLGREDYRQRLNAALDVLDAVARRDLETLRLLRLGDAERLLAGARIAYLNTKVPRRIVVGLSN